MNDEIMMNRRSFGGCERTEAQPRGGLFLLMLAALIPCSVQATPRETVSTITKLYTYTQFGSGDIIVHLASPAAVCTKGFWLSPNDPGFKTAYALLLSAYHAQTPIRISGEDTLIWPGSTDVYCRITFVGGH